MGRYMKIRQTMNMEDRDGAGRRGTDHCKDPERGESEKRVFCVAMGLVGSQEVWKELAMIGCHSYY